ncbi:amino acid adenylation domain-containing protein [Streptomyces sp. NPDC014872]|uniref:non-ribosomal peptide synthetase n=1 Tax=Streptomyces sp. NPDC014872 TaxID=3364926 RepID=UPI0036FA323D
MLPHSFAGISVSHADRPAVRHGSTQLSYRDFAQLAGGVAQSLSRLGVRRGDTVATLLERSPLHPATALGIWAVGAAYVHLECTEPDARIERLLDASGARWVIADDHNTATAARTGRTVVASSDIVPAPYALLTDVAPDDRAYLVFTSGTTGHPKAVEVEHRSLIRYTAGFLARVAPEDPASYATLTTPASDLGNTCVYAALATGARLDILDRELTLDPPRLAAELREHPVDCAKFTPSHLSALAAEGDLAGLLPRRLLVLGGERLSPSLVRDVRAVHPGLAVFNHYGPTETTIGVLMHRVTADDADGLHIPVGTPLDGVSARVLGPDGREAAHGEEGVLHVGGDCVARGYRGDAELTAEKFPRTAWGRMYRTDDVVRMDENGAYVFLGRADRQVKVRGHRVEPGEVESALLELPRVRQAWVTGERSPSEAATELVAYVVADSSAEELSGELHGALPAGLVPSRIHCVEHLPLTANGKIDSEALRGLVARPGAVGAADDDRAVHTATERLIAEIWCAVLGREQVGRDEKFLEIGGDSFKSLMVFGRLRRTFPDLTIGRLFAHPTIAGLAEALDGEAAESPVATGGMAVVEL